MDNNSTTDDLNYEEIHEGLSEKEIEELNDEHYEIEEQPLDYNAEVNWESPY